MDIYQHFSASWLTVFDIKQNLQPSFINYHKSYQNLSSGMNIPDS